MNSQTTGKMVKLIGQTWEVGNDFLEMRNLYASMQRTTQNMCVCGPSETNEKNWLLIASHHICPSVLFSHKKNCIQLNWIQRETIYDPIRPGS